jgi:hypothetical protein
LLKTIYNTTKFATQSELQHKEKAVKNIKEIRFIATNYYNLQGLRLVPIGLLLMYVCYWANVAHFPVEPSGYYSLIGAMAVILLLAFGIDRYYKRSFGVVKQAPESRKLETQLWTIGAFMATAAFWLDVSFKLPLSLVGLVAGLALVADYFRMTWLVKGHFLIYYPIGALLIILCSLLPLFGLPDWWHTIGLRAQMFGIALLLGLFTLLAGLLSHVFLAKSLQVKKELS